MRVDTVFKDRLDDHSQCRLHHAVGDGGYPQGSLLIRYRSPLAALPSGNSMPAALPFLRSRRLPCLTYCHQPRLHCPRSNPHVAAGSCRLSRQGFAIHSQARQAVWAGSCSFVLYSLRSVRFSTLLPTPPRGDAVTLSSQPGCVRSWLESLTPEGVDASQRTSGGLRSAKPMRSQWVERIASHGPPMGRRFHRSYPTYRTHLLLSPHGPPIPIDRVVVYFARFHTRFIWISSTWF